jgi:hypothetical protein
MLHYIAVNGRTGETMGSVPVQQWKLLLAALTVGTILEASHLDIGPHLMSDEAARIACARPGGRRRPVLGAVSLLPQHRQVACFERETKVEAKPVTGSDSKVGTNNGTRDNQGARPEYRRRVERAHERGDNGCRRGGRDFKFREGGFGIAAHREHTGLRKQTRLVAGSFADQDELWFAVKMRCKAGKAVLRRGAGQVRGGIEVAPWIEDVTRRVLLQGAQESGLGHCSKPRGSG